MYKAKISILHTFILLLYVKLEIAKIHTKLLLVTKIRCKRDLIFMFDLISYIVVIFEF